MYERLPGDSFVFVFQLHSQKMVFFVGFWFAIGRQDLKSGTSR